MEFAPFDEQRIAPVAEQQQQQQRRDEEEVEVLLGAGPRIWQSTQNVLRDMGLQDWHRQRQAEADAEQNEEDESDDDGPHRDRARQGAAVQKLASAREAEHVAESETRRRHRSPSPAPERDQEGNDKICRLCFADENELNDDGQSLGKLITPCRCRGSMKYVHIDCLSQWRHQSKASEAARICGQCSSRYLFRTSPWTPIVAFLQASRPLKILGAYFMVAATVLVTGVLGTAALGCFAAMKDSPLDSVRTSALALLQPPAAPWNITLSEDAREATVHFESTLQEAQGIYGSRKEAMVRASLDVIQKIKSEKGGVWAAQVDSPSDSASTSDTVEGKWTVEALEDLVGDDDVSGVRDEDLLGVRDPGGQQIKGRFRPRKPTGSRPGRDETEAASPVVDLRAAATSTVDPSKRASAMIERLYELWSGYLGDGTPTDRSNGSDPAAAAADQEKKQADLVIVYDFLGKTISEGIVDTHLLVRMMPSWLGPLRFLPYAVYLTLCERLFGITHIWSHLWVAITRCAVLLSILVCESRRELLWMTAKVMVSGLIAFVEEYFQSACPLPPNAILLGPPRSRSRRIAGWIREALAVASTAVFGPYWLNWWGGFPLSVYLGPRSFSSPERVEFSQLGPIFGPSLAVFADFGCLLLSNVSSRAAQFRETHTRWWKRSDWVQHDRSAPEGYRRMLSVLLGDEEEAKMTKYDTFLDKENARLLPGRVRPVRMARLPGESYWQTVISVGCLITVLIGLISGLGFAWETSLVQFYDQAVRSTVELIQLVKKCGPSLRGSWQAARRNVGRLRRRWASRPLEADVTAAPEGDAPLAARDTGAGPPDGEGGDGEARADAANAAEPHGVTALLGAMMGSLASLYGCFHASTWVVRIILTYLPMIPFAEGFFILETWIHFDLAQQEVLDRNDLARL